MLESWLFAILSRQIAKYFFVELYGSGDGVMVSEVETFFALHLALLAFSQHILLILLLYRTYWSK